jgi:hypothetical protein
LDSIETQLADKLKGILFSTKDNLSNRRLVLELDWQKFRMNVIQLIENNAHKMPSEDQLNQEHDNAFNVFYSELLMDYVVKVIKTFNLIQGVIRLEHDKYILSYFESAINDSFNDFSKRYYGHGYDTFSDRCHIIENLIEANGLKNLCDSEWINGWVSYFSNEYAEHIYFAKAENVHKKAIENLFILCPSHKKIVDFIDRNPEAAKDPLFSGIINDNYFSDLPIYYPYHLISVNLSKSFIINTAENDPIKAYFACILVLRNEILSCFKKQGWVNYSEMVYNSVFNKSTVERIIGHLTHFGIIARKYIDVPWNDNSQFYKISPKSQPLLNNLDISV